MIPSFVEVAEFLVIPQLRLVVQFSGVGGKIWMKPELAVIASFCLKSGASPSALSTSSAFLFLPAC